VGCNVSVLVWVVGEAVPLCAAAVPVVATKWVWLLNLATKALCAFSKALSFLVISFIFTTPP
jgi:hypothetical protein